MREAEGRETAPAARLVSVGLPVFNGEQFLCEAVESLLGQTHANLELIISDNASTDGTERICREYARRDPRVRYVRSPENRGAAWNHNRVVELAEGRFFKWAGADDVYRPEFLERCVDALDRDSDAVLAYPRTIAIDERGKHLYEYSPGWDLRSDSPSERMRAVILRGGHWVNADAVSGVIRIEAMRATRLLPAYQGGDKRPLGELSLMGKFLEVPDHLLLRRFHPQSSARNNPHEAGYDARSVGWMQEFFKGSRAGTYCPSWTLLRDHLGAIWRSRLPFGSRIRLSLAIPRVCWWHKRLYFGELRNLFRTKRSTRPGGA